MSVSYFLRSVLLALLLFGTAEVHAQGFNVINGRNHPELIWQVAETAHFEIMYPQRLAGIDSEVAPIAEASYEALSQNLGVTFDRKIRIYLSDEDEIANGFAVPLGGGFTNIWVHPSEWASTWTGREKWLRKVVAHELAHIFHYRAVASPPRWINYAFGNPTPSFWTEGLAQYETETWDAQRGDRWLRTAVLDDRLSYDDGQSAWNGRLRYAVGNAQVRFFAEQYGDSTLAKLLGKRDARLFGLVRVHDFYDAFEETTGDAYRDFYDRWRRHINVYYNTLAGQMNTVDSLGSDPLTTPGQYLDDIQFSPDTTRLAVVALPSLARPVRRLFVTDLETGKVGIVAEGAIKIPIAWSRDSQRIAFARTTRGRYGSLLNDLYMVDADGDNLHRLTYSRRAVSPTFSPDGTRLAFIGSESGTDNVFILDLETGAETALTAFSGDIQLASLRWHPTDGRLAFARITPDGTRDLVLMDLATVTLQPITDGAHDDRQPVWSPDGSHLAYTSLRDEVPNVFVTNLADGSHRRVTNLVQGAWSHDWLPADSAHATGQLIVTSNTTKTRDRAYAVDATRSITTPPPRVPAAYAGWTRHRPPQQIPTTLAPDSTLIIRRYRYRSWHNLTHVISGVIPYLFAEDDYGLFGLTAWTEPLGKHTFALAAGLSVADPDESFFFGSYLNNQWYPTVSLSLYRFPGSARYYGSDVLIENTLGGEVSASWPLDWSDQPYVGERFGVRLRYMDAEPLNPEDFEELRDLPFPGSGQQADVQLSFTRKEQRPYLNNVIHPLDGTGIRLRLLGAASLLGADTDFVRGDFQTFGVFRSLGFHRLYLYGRAQGQMGDPLPQDYLGFPRHDPVSAELPGFVPITLGDSDRVRGYQHFAVGDYVLFGSAEYRMPFLPDLQTELLGLISLGSTSLAAFVDAGIVWRKNAYAERVERLGVGVELKNAITVGGFLSFGHALGIAQPADLVGTDADYEVYYRIRAAVPF